MKTTKNEILDGVAGYYSAKLAEYGETPRGVDWNGEESQQLRFAQLGKIIYQPSGYSLNDLGCGYGALLDYLNSVGHSLVYHGYDVSKDMICAAKARHINTAGANFEVAAEPSEISDYGMASGVFNVRLGRGDAEWQEYFEETLDVLDRTSSKGFAFNCLTSYSDSDKMRDYLYYANPSVIFDLCKRRYSRNVALLHDYGLYEFTVLVRKVI